MTNFTLLVATAISLLAAAPAIAMPAALLMVSELTPVVERLETLVLSETLPEPSSTATSRHNCE